MAAEESTVWPKAPPSNPPVQEASERRKSHLRRPAARASLADAGWAGHVRAVVENVQPCVDAGRFPIKRAVGEQVTVEADCFADGHDHLSCVLQYRHENDAAWSELPMLELGNDRWRAAFTVDRIGVWRYAVTAWVDALGSWYAEFARRAEDADLAVAARMGADLIDAAADNSAAEQRAQKRRRGEEQDRRREEELGRVRDEERGRMRAWAKALRQGSADRLKAIALNPKLLDIARRHAARPNAVRSAPDLRVSVERERARFGAWYELFPRSTAAEAGRHGTFRDTLGWLDYVADMGFDVLYLPPIHPIGEQHRKGRNNAVQAATGDVGSPWGIGSAAGGHTAIHPELGTLEDFRRLLEAARRRGLEIALDMAFQAAPDHPFVKAHPEWFRWRPDGTVQYAENPPKKYQDIYPLSFDGPDWHGLWQELLGVFRFWIGQGVRIFRVDNPHTKPFVFWEWVIAEIKRSHPDTIFLAEAFTRPRIMHRLAKLGFSQSYTYFTWRYNRRELTDYFTELAQSPAREYFRPNCWPNTPDILSGPLRHGGRPEFSLRLVLAATLAANYGIYGPAFELMENRPRDDASEEYLNSEKYELRHWDLQRPDSLAPLITRINHIRRANPALQSDWSLRFHATDNDQLLCYSKTAGSNGVLMVVNLDTRFTQSGWVDLDLAALGLAADAAYEVHDLLTGARYTWRGARNFVRLDPRAGPAHILQLPAPSGVTVR